MRFVEKLYSGRWAMSLALTILVTAGWRSLSPSQLEQLASTLIGTLVLAISLPLAWPAALVLLTGAALVQLGLTEINAVKIAITQAPLTALDFRIALTDPQGLWLALHWPLWTRYAAGLVIGFSLAAWLTLLIHAMLRQLRVEIRPVQTAASVALAGVSLVAFSTALPPALAFQANTNDDLWEASALASYSDRVGTVPFLMYSFYLEQINTGPFYVEPEAPAFSPAAVHDAEAAFVRVAPGPRPLPNIVVMFAESTFNPDWAFSLDRRIDSSLFAPQPDTQMLSPLYVNAVGYGSWISEFESVVGVDSRLFGYSGFYTHSTLSPFVRRSFVTYLRDKGYDTAAYYSWPGHFYNARRAYENYGFERFLDAEELGLPPSGSDVDVAAAAIERLKSIRSQPAFSYIVLYENHSPHNCQHFSSETQFTARFSAPADFRQNCEFNEYLRRLSSTARAVEQMDAYLREVERTTGRPYVLVTFGDHQPNTFTHTKMKPMSSFDYRPARTAVTDRHTFVHIRSSAPDPLDCCGSEPPPAFLLPTLMSAYTAKSGDDLYLPQNLAVFRSCGSEVLSSVQSEGVMDLKPRTTGARSYPDCPAAYRSWLASIRRSGPF